MKAAEATLMSDEWLTVEETKEALGKSLRTIQKLAQSKQLKSKRLPRPGRGPETVYWAQDVERLKVQAPPPPPRADATTQNGALTIKDATPKRVLSNDAFAILETLKLVHAEFRASESDRWLKLGDAAKVVGLPKAFLRRAIEEGKLPAIKAGSLFIKRAHLAEFEG